MASFKNLVSTTSAQISSGGTITGDLVINGDLQVDGGGSLSFDEIVQGTSQVKVTDTSAFLVEKADGTDVFVVDTTNSRVKIDGNLGIGDTPHASRKLVITGTNTTNATAAFYTNAVHTGTTDNAVFSVRSDNASASGTVVNIHNDGSGACLNINSNGSGPALITDASVGIGGTPTKTLTVQGASGQIANITNGSNNLVMYVDNSNVQIANNTSLAGAEKINMSTANEAIEFYTDGTERARITSTGLGIGGTPSDDLHVINSDNVYLQLESSNAGTTKESAIKYSNFSTGSNFWWVGLNQSDDYSLAYGTSFSGSNTMFLVTETGNIGVGTTSPTASKLSLSHTNDTDYDSYKSNLGGTASTHHVADIKNSSNEDNSNKRYALLNFASGFGNSATGQSIIGNVATGSKQGNFIIGTRGGDSSPTVSEKFRVTHDGNVGIGTASPATNAKLHVVDGAGTAPTMHAGDMVVFQNNDDTSDNAGIVVVSGTGSGTSNGLSYLTFGDSAVKNQGGMIYYNGNDSLEIRTNATSAINIDSSQGVQFAGNVGIGDTPHTSRKLVITGTNTTNATSSVYTNAVHTGTTDNAVFSVRSDNASASGTVVNIHNDGSGACLNLNSNGSGPALVTDANVGIGMAPASSVTLDINISTDARGSFMDGISEIGSDFFGLNVTNSAGNILKPMGIRAEDIRLVTGSAERMRVTDSGVGIGTSAARQLHVHGADGGQVDGLHITNTDTGATSSDGFTIGLDANENAFFFGRESGKKIEFYPSGTKRFSIDDNSRISLSNNDSGGTGGTDSTSGNTIFGYLAGSSIQDTSIDNTYIGHKSGASTTTADNNVAIGARALFSTTVAGNSVAVGELSGYSVTDHGNNVFVGQTAGFHQTGESNVFIGKDAGLGSSGDSGDDNVVIGKSASLSGASSANQTVIGKGATGQADNSVTLGNSSVTKLYIAPGNTSGQTITFKDDSAESGFIQYDHSDDQMKLASNNAIAMRIFDSVILIGRSSAGSTGNGHSIRTADSAIFSRDSAGETMQICRNASDGQFIQFRSNGTIVGDIKNTGGTVSLTGFSGCHESSSSDTLEVGTVVSTIDEEHSENHAKVEISNSVGDKRVYGVVSDLEGLNGNNVTVASVGISSIKVTGSCKGGDLLESNGDGTAKVQSDDIIRSKTIGKVTMGNSDEEVKLVSCVLYCG